MFCIRYDFLYNLQRMAKPEDLEEFKEIILQASQGNWIPMTILASCLGVIMILVSYIYTKNEKTNSKRHDSHDKTAERLSENQTRLTTLVERMDVKIENHEIRINDNKEDIKTMRK